MISFRAEIAQQTLKILKTSNWNEISFTILCQKLKLNKKKLPTSIKNKNDLLKNINQYFDDQIMIAVKSVDKSTPRDMLFEILMLRFELLNRYRKSILKMFNFFKYKPKSFILLLPSLINSSCMMAKVANIETKGMIGSVNTKGLLIIYFSTFLTWIEDENSSLDRTMNALDNYLEKAENILKFLKN